MGNHHGFCQNSWNNNYSWCFVYLKYLWLEVRVAHCLWQKVSWLLILSNIFSFFLSISPLQNSASVSFCQARAKWNSSACDWKAWLNCTNGKLCSYANRVSKRSMVFSRHNLYFPNAPPLLLKDCYSPPPNPNITPPPLLLQASFCPQLFGPIKSKLAAKLWRKYWDSPTKIKPTINKASTINKHPPKYTILSPTSILFWAHKNKSSWWKTEDFAEDKLTWTFMYPSTDTR